MYDVNDLASGAAYTTPSATFGVFTYDDTLAAPVADQGVCFNYFGGSVSFSNGTLTLAVLANGLFRGAV